MWALSYISQRGKETSCQIEKSGSDEPEKKCGISKVERNR
jgi:hypothetical protein